MICIYEICYNNVYYALISKKLISMKKKGILLCGGVGTRFKPITYAVNKHLLPIYNKPMFFYSLSVLMLGGIKNIQIVSDSNTLDHIERLISKIKINIKISYQIQEKAKGIVDGILKSEKFINNSDFVLMLGDNFFFGQSLSDQLKKIFKKKNCIVSIKSNKPSNFGVIQQNNKGQIVRIVEKPKKFLSKNIATGLYVYENNCLKICKNLKPSRRGELEITDLNNILIKKKKLENIELGRGSVWLDAGSPNDLLKASQMVKLLEENNNFKIADLEEISKY